MAHHGISIREKPIEIDETRIGCAINYSLSSYRRKCRNLASIIKRAFSVIFLYRKELSKNVKVYLESYGCTMNQGEAREIAHLLENQGHIIVPSEKDAEGCILVTCTVIEATERRMIKRMKVLSSLKRPLVVGGCMASCQKRKIVDTAPDVMILPPRNLQNIINFFPSADSSKRAVSKSTGSSIDAIVPIAQGCLGKCTYCITRLARGKLRSYPKDAILDKVKRHLQQGCREIRITSQDTA